MASDGMDSERQRYCPICEQRYTETTCPIDGVMTIPVAMATGPVDLPAGQVVAGRYRIDRPLGAGGMARVFRATQLSMQRPVALKVIQASMLQDGLAIKRFYREAKAASQLSHPNIVNVHDFGVDDDTNMPFIAMELVEGRNLGRLLTDEGALAEPRVCNLLAQVAKALVEAHAKGVVHRDLKPENIMVSTHRDGTEHVTVLDFGIAKVVSAKNDGPDSLTASGVALGTPRYMAPEQIFGEQVDLRADLYAVGCILHELMTGRPPYEAQKAAEVMLKHVHEPAPVLPAGLGSPAVRSLHAVLLQKEPKDRRLTTAQLAQRLSQLAARAGTDSSSRVGSAIDGNLMAEPVPAAMTDAELGVGVEARRGRLGQRAVVVGLAVAVAAAAAGLVALRPGREVALETIDPGAPAAVPRAMTETGGPEASAPETESPPADPTPPRPADTPSVPPDDRPPASATEVVVRVTSVPSGALVVDGGDVLGRTPLDVRVSGDRRRVTLRLAGHRSASRVLTASGPGGVRVLLKARRKKPDDFPPLAPR